MTIYAIVNQLLSPDHATQDAGPVWTLISQTAILQGGNPYFVPDFASRFEARPALAVRIGKLGKGIAPRFAFRYAESVAPAVVFVAADMLEQRRRQGLPWSEAMSYDRALAIGKFRPLGSDAISSLECTLSIQSPSGTSATTARPAEFHPAIEETIAAISRDNTLKTGDILLLGLAGSGPVASPDTRATLMLNGEESLAFNIR